MLQQKFDLRKDFCWIEINANFMEIPVILLQKHKFWYFTFTETIFYIVFQLSRTYKRVFLLIGTAYTRIYVCMYEQHHVACPVKATTCIVWVSNECELYV